jgi:threonine dehydrogenase-like Zn-dependent dehydrogenase
LNPQIDAVFRRGPKKAAVVRLSKPVPQAGEVLVKVAYAGICGSDVNRFSEDIPKWDGLVLGHEFSGTVAELGPGLASDGAAGVAVGDRVSAAPLVPCHRCDQCRTGNFSLCKGYSFIGSRVNGCFADYVAVPAANLVPLGADFPLELGAFIEPVTVCLHPILRLDNLLGKTVVVTGLGAIGLIAVQIFKAMGAKSVVASDVVPEKLALAEKLGATRAVNVLAESLEAVVEAMGGADVVFESSGSNPAKKSAIKVARGGGQVLLVGTSPADISFEAALFELITRKELRIVGSWMNYSAPWPGKEWSTAVWMLKRGLIDVAPLATHRFPFSRVQEALDVLFVTKENYIKILLTPEAPESAAPAAPAGKE